jgi:hypothetical protein
MADDLKRLRGDELFEYDGFPQPVSVTDFWSWSMSRLLADGPRAYLAEFIVRVALGADISKPGHGWGEYDVDYEKKDGGKLRVEVKCSSVIQAWLRKTDSSPRFGIAPTLNCMIKQNENGQWYYHGPDNSIAHRRSDIYIFCLFNNDDRETADLLKLEQWKFWIFATKYLNQHMGNRRHITINTLRQLGAVESTYGDLLMSFEQYIERHLP